MIRGLYTSGLGMITQMQRMDVITNNIANAHTTSFKKDIAVSKPFSEELMKRLNDSSDMRYANNVGQISLGVFLDDIHTDFSAGALENTNAPLDLSISGSGFFVIQTQDANGDNVEQYSRDGSFTILSDGTLGTKTGERVMGESGIIHIPSGVVEINDRGDIFSANEYVGTVRLVDFENPQTLRKSGNNLYTATEASVETAFTGKVTQGFLEGSNTNAVREMVDMITTSRVYDINQRMITIHDAIMARSVNDLGRK